MTHLFPHLLATYTVLVAPWLGCIVYERARRRFLSGDRLAKVQFYRSGVAEQIVMTGSVLGLWRFGGVSGISFGIRAPYSWFWTTSALVVLVIWLLWTGMRLRPKAEKIRKRFQESMGMLFPDSRQERNWFGVLSVGAGISEELVYRGFLMYYVGEYVPHSNMTERVLLTSVIFGLAHIYQGWKRAIPTGILGLIFAVMYVISGSLLLPIVVHAATDWRLLLILPPQTRESKAMESAA
jgi:uncharacterized protein